MKKLWILLFVFLYADVVNRGISEATPEEVKRFKEEKIKRGFVPPVEQCSYENEDYWIKIFNTCREEGEYYCPSVMILIDKKKDLVSDTNSEATVIATGHLIKSWHPNGNSYVFYDDNDLKYWITNYEPTELKIEAKQETEARYPYKTIYEKNSNPAILMERFLDALGGSNE